MKPSNYSVAKALCNLASLGWTHDAAQDGAREWSHGQQEFGLKALRFRDAFTRTATACEIARGRLYLTARYGCYPKVFRVLAKHSRGKTLYCPAANLGDQLTQLAQKMMKVVRVKAEFLPISIPNIQLLQEKIAQGHNVLLLPDVPFRSGKLTREKHIETCIGQFRATSAVSRLPAMIDPHFRGVFIERREGRDTVCAMGNSDFATVMRAFAEQVRKRPTHFESLPDLHRNWTLPDRPDIAVVFDHEGSRMLLHSQDMRAWKLREEGSPAEHARALSSADARARLSEKLGVPIDGVFAV